MKKVYIALIMLGCVLTLNINALELKEGRIKLILHESSGRISIFYQNKLASEEYTSLLLRQDPRTSGIILIVNNKLQRLGDTFEYEQSIVNTRSGSSFVWKSKQLKVTESFSFITSPGGSIADGIKIELEIENISEDSLSVGMKYLFDTYLGETNRGESHFFLSDNSVIKSESTIKGLLPDYWISAEAADSEIGLLVMLDNEVVTSPDRITFANWKRLDESGWTLNIKDGRNFNLLPYSINDSAVSHYYEPIRIPSGSKRVITLVLGNKSPTGFSTTSKTAADSSLDDLYNRVASENTSGRIVSQENSIRNELTLTEDLITHIDRLLESNEALTENELATLRVMIETLEKTKAKFED
ncbi:MAG: hypothetical protein JEZ04_18510 [Spirochaetales bacterium]|nr:hypothetical protein [Spirochaetales bacterium]